MKTKIVLMAIVTLATIACNRNRARFLDLTTNEYVDVKQNAAGEMVNPQTGEPVELYVDTKTRDTIYGPTAEVVNGRVGRNEKGLWVIKSDGDEFKAKSESENSAKVKIEGDEFKAKDGNYTIKREGDGDVKIENGRTQTKIDGKTGRIKTKKDRNITDKVKKIFH